MKSKNKQILIVGDRILIRPDKGGKKSKAGLYLPPSVIEKQEVLSGVVVEVGPGIPMGNPEDQLDEPWSARDNSPVKYIPTQAELGDVALFLNKASIEVKIENEDYLIVPQSAILILIRDDLHSLAD
ncbi:MAG TPA: co-chaperone GroES [Candidatus Marinimicrobia bacterium]|jgi:co-chaperonin GroES (HSP10)|nr:co-chaperone GroES [Candidatus Neomarinimicrobiota bacterium]HIB80159.1 co-chaperone GroES [Candidatus Neomarinimicrobiota bacterium]|tara:strand:- start:58 stop:438 length:381 start_codon:yes stop_codon:yes gene_type:complete